MTGKKATKLGKLVVDEISLVDAPANPGAHVLLWKRKTPAAVKKSLRETVLDCVAKLNVYGVDCENAMTFGELYEAAENNELVDVLAQSLRSIYADAELSPEDKLAAVNASIDEFLTVLNGGGQENETAMSGGMDTAQPAPTMKAKPTQHLEGNMAGNEQNNTQDLINKALEPLQKQLADAVAKNEALTKSLETTSVELQKQKETIAKAERITKAKELVGELANISVDDVADMLSVLSTEQADKLGKFFKASAEQAKLAKALEQSGANYVEKAGSAISVAKSRAADLRKADPKLSEQAAMSAVWHADPKLYDQYQAEAH